MTLMRWKLHVGLGLSAALAMWDSTAAEIVSEELRTKIDAACLGQSGEICASTIKNARLSLLPRPRATDRELTQRCTDGASLSKSTQWQEFAKRNSEGASLMRRSVNEWAAEHFGERAYVFEGRPCEDAAFVVRQWQRAVGNAETGMLTPADVQDFEARWTPVIVAINDHVLGLDSRYASTPPAPAPSQPVRGRSDRSGVTIFGFELGAEFLIPPCDFRFRPDLNRLETLKTCASQDSASVKDGKLLSIFFSSSEKPGFITSGVGYVDRLGFNQFTSGDVEAGLINGAIEYMHFGTPYGQLPTVVESLDNKFGQHVKKDVPMHNSAAASWNGVSYAWKSGEVIARIECLDFGKQYCIAMVSTDTWWTYLEQSRLKEGTKGRQL